MPRYEWEYHRPWGRIRWDIVGPLSRKHPHEFQPHQKSLSKFEAGHRFGVASRLPLNAEFTFPAPSGLRHLDGFRYPHSIESQQWFIGHDSLIAKVILPPFSFHSSPITFSKVFLCCHPLPRMNRSVSALTRASKAFNSSHVGKVQLMDSRSEKERIHGRKHFP